MLKQSLKVASTFIATTLALAVTTHSARALNFTFSFDNVVGNTPGTVSGIITGLEDNTTDQAADSVIITNFPDALGGSFNNGNDAVAWNDVFFNTFTVISGNITDAQFGAREFGDDWLRFGNNNFFYLDSNVTQVRNEDGFAGVTFESASTPVPFEISPNMGLAMLAGIWGISRLRKNIVARNPFK